MHSSNYKIWQPDPIVGSKENDNYKKRESSFNKNLKDRMNTTIWTITNKN